MPVAHIPTATTPVHICHTHSSSLIIHTWSWLACIISHIISLPLLFGIAIINGIYVGFKHWKEMKYSIWRLMNAIYTNWYDPPFQSVIQFVEESNHDIHTPIIKQRKRSSVEDITLHAFNQDINMPSDIPSHAHAKLSLTSVQVTTDDGYHLTLHHIISDQPPTRGPVLLQHGLLQTCLPFLMERNQSLGVYLARQGYDVWLGNNRGTRYSRSHTTLSPSHPEFWHFSIDDLALDVKANVTYIHDITGQKVAYIGHSQGCAQALAALCTSEKTRQCVDVFVALAPGTFVRPFPTQTIPLHLMSLLYRLSPHLFFIIFGYGAFAQWMEPARDLAVSCRMMPLLGYLCSCLFKAAMTWGDELWSKSRKNLYFRETPSNTSSRVVAHWIQQSLTSSFCHYDHGYDMNKIRYGSEIPPKYDLSHVNTPTAVIYGARDQLLDFERLIKELGSHCKFSKCIPHHQHLDSLVAEDAHHVVYPDIISFIESQRA